MNRTTHDRTRGMLAAAIEPLEHRTLFSAGDLDPGFGTAGSAYATPGGVFAPVSTDHRGGRTVVLGSTQYEESQAAKGTANILVLNAAGKLDTSFSGDGVRPMPRLTNPRDVFVQPDGKILVAGTVDGVAGVARMLASGAADTSFSGDGFVTFPQFDVATGVRLTASNRVVVSGFRSRTGTDAFAVARTLSNGGVDTQFSGDGQAVLAIPGRANAVAVQSDGKVVLVGTEYGEYSRNVAVVRLGTGGSYDASFNGTGRATYDSGPAVDINSFDEGQAVDLTPAGKILVGAYCGSSALVLRYTVAGVREMEAVAPVPLESAFVTRVNDVRSSFDGKQIYVAFDGQYQGYADGYVARLDDDGTPDYTFGDLGVLRATYDRATADLTADGKLVVVGDRGGTAGPSGDGSDFTRIEAHRLLTVTPAADRIQYRPDGPYTSNNVYVEGTNGNDTITATRLPDGRVQVKLNSTVRIFPGDANNIEFIHVDGGGGNDTIDTSTSGLAASANGGYGDDNINLGTSDFPEYGGMVIVGGPGNDTLRGGNRDDALVGGGAGSNGFGLRENDADDLLLGGGGNDELYGGLGRDRLYGEAGDDHLYATYSPDSYFFDGLKRDGVPDYLDGGLGTDTVHYKEPGDATNGVEAFLN